MNTLSPRASVLLPLLFLVALLSGCASARPQARAAAQAEDVTRQLARAWSVHDTNAVDRLFAEEFVYEDRAVDVVARTPEELKRFMRMTFEGVPDFEVELTNVFSTGNRVASEWVMTGTHTGALGELPPTGQSFSVQGASVTRVEDGRIIEHHDYYDEAEFMRQLGLLPPPGQAATTTEAAARQAETAHRADADSAQAAAAIRRLSEGWIEAFEQGDAEAFAEFFTDDAIYAANNGELLRGRSEIRDALSRWVAPRPEGVKGDVRSTELRFRVVDDAAYTLIRFHITATPPGRVVEAGHLLAVLRRQPDGSWLIESIVGNRDPQ